MSRVGKAVWVRDPGLADTDVFRKGVVISEDATQVKMPPSHAQAPARCKTKLLYVRTSGGDVDLYIGER